MRRLRPSPALVVAIVALVAAVGGFAVASIPSGNGTIHACYQKENGQLRVIDKDANQSCRPSEVALTFNQKGPAGPTGPAGPKGATGPAGPTGPSGTGGGGATTLKASRPGEVTTSSETYVEFDGPSITFTVPAGRATVVVAAGVEGRTTEHDPGDTWEAAVNCGEGDRLIGNFTNDTYVRSDIGFNRIFQAGTHTCRLRYRTENSDNPAFFRNRQLHVTVLP